MTRSSEQALRFNVVLGWVCTWVSLLGLAAWINHAGGAPLRSYLWRSVIALAFAGSSLFMVAIVVVPKLRIPVDAGHQFRSMPGQDSGPCRATVPVDAGRGV